MTEDRVLKNLDHLWLRIDWSRGVVWYFNPNDAPERQNLSTRYTFGEVRHNADGSYAHWDEVGDLVRAGPPLNITVNTN